MLIIFSVFLTPFIGIVYALLAPSVRRRRLIPRAIGVSVASSLLLWAAIIGGLVVLGAVVGPQEPTLWFADDETVESPTGDSVLADERTDAWDDGSSDETFGGAASGSADTTTIDDIDGTQRSDDAKDATTGETPPFAGTSGSEGWITLVASLTQAQIDESRAEGEASRWRGNGHSASVLDSTRYSSLRPGYWIVYIGPYADQASAQSYCDGLRASGASSDCYVRDLIPR